MRGQTIELELEKPATGKATYHILRGLWEFGMAAGQVSERHAPIHQPEGIYDTTFMSCCLMYKAKKKRFRSRRAWDSQEFLFEDEVHSIQSIPHYIAGSSI